MEFFVILGIFLLIGNVLGWVSFFKVRGLESQISKLKSDLNQLRRKIFSEPHESQQPVMQSSTTDAPTIASVIPDEDSVKTQAQQNTESDMPENEPETETTPDAEDEIPEKNTADWDYDTIESTAPDVSKKAKDYVLAKQVVDPDEIFRKFKDNWMLWIGGLSVALAGIFLARYAIVQGVLGPVGRITAGIITGLSLHIAAEYFRRKTAENHATFAMLAAGGSITLFATLLAALHYYQMFSPMLVFVVLAVVAVATMWLSMIHGPILAAMGMVGAYVLPVMVSTGSGDIIVALAYSLIITSSILLLLQYVSRSWLWYGMMAGSLFWWLVSLDNSNGDIWREWYLAVLAYGVISVMNRDWFLQRLIPFAAKDRFYAISSKHLAITDRWLVVSLLLIVLAQQFSVLANASYQLYFPSWIPIAAIILIAARNNAYLSLHAWLSMVGVVATIFTLQFDERASSLIAPINELKQSDFLTNMSLYVLVFSGFGLLNSRKGEINSSWAAMTLVTPILALITTYLCLPTLFSDGYWTLTALMLGALYIFLATVAKSRVWDTAWQVWLYLSGHFAYSFAAATYFENGTLTLVLALQAVSIALIIKRFGIPQLGWLLKLVVTVTVLRLSANPWLMDYPTTEHWTIWTYGGSCLAVFGAGYLLTEYEKLRKWTEGAAIHLLVLALWVECRYYLYDGAVFQREYSFVEASLTTLIFGALALVYYYRSSLSQHSQKIYRYYSYLLMVLTWGNYSFIVAATLNNDSEVWKNISATPILNIMLLTYGIPVVFAILAMKYFIPKLSKYFEYLTGLTALIFINLEIRHLWQGNLNLHTATSDGEFYTYSVFWLLAAIVMILAGGFKFGRRYYKVGLTMLAAVVVKVFLFDMSQLDGIYRILAFMGLGLSLLGMAYIHKKLIAVLDERDA